MKPFCLLACLASLLVSCQENGYLTIVQGDRQISIRGSGIQDIDVDKSFFRIQARIKPYDEAKSQFHKISLLASDNAELFAKINTGGVIDDESLFGPGRGMAADFGGGSLYVSDDGFNSLYYEPDEGPGGPMKLVKKTFGHYVAAADVNVLASEGSDGWIRRSVSQYRADRLHLIFFYDRNLNGMIDNGELHKTTIKFKSP